ncbi:hypothetical protein JTE90_015311 [Oedothorax gibbosus]|uniref:Uncharacterized protein n=1 Tax=Oedothorax gibbosus TaxID=931172 RepID=A0AAV6VQ19_9ARAC|nr:hypothetical protein JTE90_015311 [Oedothorax gibbosus]
MDCEKTRHCSKSGRLFSKLGSYSCHKIRDWNAPGIQFCRSSKMKHSDSFVASKIREKARCACQIKASSMQTGARPLWHFLILQDAETGEKEFGKLNLRLRSPKEPLYFPNFEFACCKIGDLGFVKNYFSE